ncbi:MAG: hypothetical protein H6923_07710 [Alphaproteobacteria bacterium]|nr:hypothetical protein [Alphaproteobacteria bacterium]
MAEGGAQNLKFCEEGHIFDLASSERCPQCGSPAAGGGAKAWAPQKSDTPPDGGSAAKDDLADKGARRPEPVPPRPNPMRGLLEAFERLGLPAWALPSALGALLVALLAIFLWPSAPTPAGPAPTQKAGPAESDRVVDRFTEEKPAAQDEDLAASEGAYGLWEIFLNLGPPTGTWRQVLEIRDDGTYTIHDAVYGHAGRMTFTGRHYTLKSRTNIFEDEGVFSRPDHDTLVFEGRLGRTVWTRVHQQPLFALTDSGPRLPKDVPAVVGEMVKDTRASWREDAILVRLQIERNKYNDFDIRGDFVSPQDFAGLNLTWTRFATNEFEHKAVNWGTRAIPERFLDLPEAYAALKESAALKRATLDVDQGGRLLWGISSERGTGGAVNAAVQ